MLSENMETRWLGKTGLKLPALSFGASSLGLEFRNVKLDEALESVRVALDCGLNFIDTSPFYGRGMSEVLLGIALRDVPRNQFTLCTKLGRYDLNHFDFSAKRVAESVDVSLHRLGTDHLDIVLCHDIEFVKLPQIVEETIPALRKIQQAGKVRFVGFSGYPQKLFRLICDQIDVDCVLSYNQYTLQNTRFADETIPYLKAKGVGVMNAGPFSARLLTNAPLPPWLKEPENVKAAARAAAAHCAKQKKLRLLPKLRGDEHLPEHQAGERDAGAIQKWHRREAPAERAPQPLVCPDDDEPADEDEEEKTQREGVLTSELGVREQS